MAEAIWSINDLAQRVLDYAPESEKAAAEREIEAFFERRGDSQQKAWAALGRAEAALKSDADLQRLPAVRDFLLQEIRFAVAADPAALAREREARKRAERERDDAIEAHDAVEAAYMRDTERLSAERDQALARAERAERELQAMDDERLSEARAEGWQELREELDAALARAEKAENECEQARAERDEARRERERYHAQTARISSDLADAVGVVRRMKSDMERRMNSDDHLDAPYDGDMALGIQAADALLDRLEGSG